MPIREDVIRRVVRDIDPALTVLNVGTVSEALGATRAGVLANVPSRGVVLAMAGVAIGGVGALFVTRRINTLLYDVTPTDPGTFALAATVFGAVALIAAYVPARRATRVSPLVALRSE